MDVSELADLMSFSQLAKKIGVSKSAVRSWVYDGRTAANGKRVFMKFKHMTWGHGVSMKYYQKFIEELNQDEDE